MDTPITISSTLSSIGKSHKKNTEPSIARVPVSWDSPRKPCDRETSCTPTTLQKVNNWINSLSRLSRDHVESNTSSHRQSSDFSDYDIHNGLNIGGDLVDNMIVMSDDNKSDLKDRMADDELENYCRSSYEYENGKGSQSTLKIPDDSMYGGGPKKHGHPKAIKRRKSLQNYNLMEKDSTKSDDYDSDVPLSPESEKKKELCSYLQLMKPTDKKTVMILQNRRSVRVKNLSLMQEKRELEKKLREANTEIANENSHSDSNLGAEQNYPGLKSFDEMNVDLDKKKYKWLKYTGTKSSYNDSFYFPKPSDDLKKTINDFDEVKVSWFEKIKETSDKKQHIISKNQLKEKKDRDKKNGEDVSTQDNKCKNKVEGGKQKMNAVSEYIQFKKNKIESTKNDYSILTLNDGTKKRIKTKDNNTTEDNNRLKTRMVEISKKEDSNGGKKKNDTNKTRKSQNRFDNNFDNAKLRSLPSLPETPQFLIPKPSKHFVQDVNDFDVIIERNKDLIRNNISPNFNVKVGNKVEQNSEILARSENVNPTSSIRPSNENAEAENKVLDISKTKEHLLKKKEKVKRLSAERKTQRSSFKIKLKPRRKSLGPPAKSNKKLTRSKSHDNIRSLRTRNIENPTLDINSLRIGKTKKEQNSINKKENIKQKGEKLKDEDLKSKPLENDTEIVLKMPLKDTNENPFKSANLADTITSPNREINCKIIDNDSKSFTSRKASLKTNSLQNLMSDIDFSNLSTEHKSSLLIENIDRCDSPPQLPIIAIYHKNSLNGLETENFLKNKVKEKCEFYSQILNIEKYPEEESQSVKNKSNVFSEKINKTRHDYFKKDENQTSLVEKRQRSQSEFHSLTEVNKRCLTPVSSKEKSDTNSEKIHKNHNETTPFIFFKKDIGVKSLHKCLNSLTQKSISANLEVDTSPTSWPLESPTHKRKKNQHSINICKEHGSVLKAFYLEYNLVLCQEFMVSFWTQTALGNVLGAQNMWIHKGSVQRMAMNNNCIFKESLEMVVSTDNTVAYIELWTKEHQSDIREGPVADVFATVYFWKKGQNGLDKKVLQLENINGFADDVQYSVLKSTPKVIVSWHLACSELESKKTYVHCYQLAADYQTVFNISEFEAVEHYVSSLHNIEGCDSLIMGCGENKITLWNIDYGYVVATIEMSEIKSPLSTLWVQCDRGFLFTLQQCVDRELRLIAIHGMNHSWKKLASYVPPDEYDRLKGVCVENGIILAFYDQGILCWNAQTAETIVEESHNEAEYISGKYVISVVNDQVNIRHAITHLLSAEDS